MQITTVSLDKSTRDGLRSIKQEHEFEHYDETISWLIKEVGGSN
jgi:hypothetical protein